jgi:MFS family permease
MILLAIISSIGILLEVVYAEIWCLIIGRFVNGIATGIAANVVPMYQSECSPADIRGALITFYQFFQNIGYVLASGIGNAFGGNC